MEVLELKASLYLKRRHVDRNSRRCNQRKEAVLIMRTEILYGCQRLYCNINNLKLPQKTHKVRDMSKDFFFQICFSHL